LIELGIDSEARKNNGNTVMHEAANYDAIECIIFLAAVGIPIDAKNNHFKTPL